MVGDHIYYSAKYPNLVTAKSTADFTDFQIIQRTEQNTGPPPVVYVSGGEAYTSYVLGNQVYTARNFLDSSGWESIQQTNSATAKWRTYLQAVGDTLYYAYMEDTVCGWQVFTAESNLDLTEWHATQRTDFCNTSAGEIPTILGGHVRFQVAGGRIYYAWSYPDEDGYWQVWTAEMNKDGTGWEAYQRTDTATDKWRPELHVVGNKIYLAWWEGSSSWTGGTLHSGVYGSNIVAKGGSFGLGLDEDLRLSGFVNNDHNYDLFLASANPSAGESVSGSIRDGWNHVAVTYDETSLKLYINGEFVGEKSYTEKIKDNPFSVLIGDNFKGLIDEVRISDRALSAAEIKNHYRLATGEYYWKVAAEDQSGNYTESAAWSFTIVGPDKPVLLLPADQAVVSDVTPQFAWSATAGSDGYYIIQYASDAQFTKGVVTDSVLHPATTYVPRSPLSAGGSYYWRVSAVDANDMSSGYQDQPFVFHISAAPETQVQYPANLATTQQGYMGLSASVYDEDGDPMTVMIYGGADSQASDLLYVQDAVPSGQTVTYLWDAAVLRADADTVGLWHFDEGYGFETIDESDYFNDGRLLNGAIWTNDGKFGRCLSFDGIDDYVEVAHSQSLSVAGPMTVEAWVNPAVIDQTTWRAIVRKGQGGSTNYILTSNKGRPSFVTYLNEQAYGIIGSVTDWSAGSWHYVAGVYDGSYLRLYANGKEIGRTAAAGIPGTDSNVLHIGDNTMGGARWAGLIDEVRISKRALSPQEIFENYRLKNGTYFWQILVSDGFTGVQSDTREFEVVADSIDFNLFDIQSYGGTQDENSLATIEDNGGTLQIAGNGWKKIYFPYVVTSNTVLEFDFNSSIEGEIHGIGFDDDDAINNPIRTFQLFGTQSWGIPDFNDYQYTAPNWKHYRIPVGQFYTGDMLYMTFTNDHDTEPQDGESVFSNIRVWD